MPGLPATIAEVRRRIQQGSKRGLNEQNTKATLIEPVLRALGWDIENVDEVQREFKIKKSDKPVDYGLLVLRTPRLFIEAKPLGDNLEDRRWANQIMGYATVAGVEWIVLTDGNEYRIYNSHAPVNVDEKLSGHAPGTDGASSGARTARDGLCSKSGTCRWSRCFMSISRVWRHPRARQSSTGSRVRFWPRRWLWGEPGRA